MKSEKITAEEIAELHQQAVAERKKRQLIQKAIEEVVEGISISPELQMEIVTRGHKDEIMPMLQEYKYALSSELAPETQLYLFNHIEEVKYRPFTEFMLKNLNLCSEMEHKFLSPHCSISPDFSFYERKFSEDGEVFMLSSRLAQGKGSGHYSGKPYLKDPFAPVKTYIKLGEFSPKAQVYLMKEYYTVNGTDSFIDQCLDMIKYYIKTNKNLCLAAEEALIKSGNHEAIMLYIELAFYGLKAKETLLERGNAEEVRAYFKRWATL